MFGELIKERRIERGLTLREFSRLAEVDPSNWSKIERGLMAPPQDEERLEKIASVLNIEIGSDSWNELRDEAQISAGLIPEDLLSDERVLGSLPLFFRTIRSEKPTPEELDKLVEVIRKGI